MELRLEVEGLGWEEMEKLSSNDQRSSLISHNCECSEMQNSVANSCADLRESIKEY